MRRRHIAIDGFDHIGKESNRLEQVEEGGVPAESGVCTVYNDPGRDAWSQEILPRLRAMTLSDLIAKTGFDRRTLQRIRAGEMPKSTLKPVVRSKPD